MDNSLLQVNKKAKLSPGSITMKVGKKIDKKRQWQREKSKSIGYKRNRVKRKVLHVQFCKCVTDFLTNTLINCFGVLVIFQLKSGTFGIQSI